MPDLPDDSRDNAIVAKRGVELPSIKPTETLTLKRGVGQVVVRQSFSHGRSKTVLVEKVKRRSAHGIPGIQGKKAGKKARGARNSTKNIRASSLKSKPTGKPFSVNELLLGEDDGSPRKRRKKGRASGGGSSLQYRKPSAGLPGNEHVDPNPAGRRGSWRGAR